MLQLPIYIQQIWSFYLGMVAYFEANVNTSNPLASYGLYSSMFSTCRSFNKLLSIYNASWFLASETATLDEVLLLPVQLDAYDLNLITNRVNALKSFYQAVTLELPNIPVQNFTLMESGTDMVPSFTDIVNYVMTTLYETPPSGLTNLNCYQFLQDEITAWTNFQTALVAQGISYTGNQMNAITRMIAISTLVSNNASTLTFSSNWSAEQLWNWIAFYPSALNLISLLETNLAQSIVQNILVVRYMITLTMLQMSSFILTARSQPISQVQLGTLLMNNSLMDFAAKNMGDYSQWTEVITANNLQPPFISQTPSPNEVSPGQQLFLPTGQQSTPILPQQPTYELNFLGTDIYYGPSSQDLVWTGDFQIITGYANIQNALLRRLKTPIGSLIYHSVYGSRIPGEIGAIASTNITSHIDDYAESALLGDPRVESLTNAVSLYTPKKGIDLALTVQLMGNGAALNLNEVISEI